MCQERPLMHSLLRELGLPMIPMRFHTNRTTLTSDEVEFPLVIKVGTAHGR